MGEERDLARDRALQMFELGPGVVPDRQLDLEPVALVLAVVRAAVRLGAVPVALLEGLPLRPQDRLEAVRGLEEDALGRRQVQRRRLLAVDLYRALPLRGLTAGVPARDVQL